MLVKDVMNSPVLSVPEGLSLQEAHDFMYANKVRHLPVVREGRVVGVITDRDVRLACSPLAKGTVASPSTPVNKVMSHPVVIADPLDPVEEAARTMRTRKIGCLPVLENDELVGIVTGIDLLDALLKLTGVEKPSGRLELRLPDEPGQLALLTGYLADQGVNVHSLLTYPEDALTVRSVLRVNTQNTRALAEELRRQGLEVLWPPEKPWM